MTKAMTRSDIVTQGYSLDDAAIAEIERMRDAGELGDGYKTVPQCHICCEVESKDLVNKLIAAGLTNREIVKCCDGINARRAADENDGRIIDHHKVWYHKRNHFNVDEPAQAVYRQILERRAQEQNLDHVNGIAHAITTYGVLEAVMVKGWEQNIADPNAPISVSQMMDSAKTIHELTNRDQGQRQMAEVMATMGRIIALAQKYIPEDQREAFVVEVEGGTAVQHAISERVEETIERTEREARVFVAPSKTDERDVL